MATTASIGTFFGETPIISANGRYVIYVTKIDELTNDTNRVSDVLMQDLATGSLSLISVSSQGALGNSPASTLDRPAVSADGRFIVFASDATNLVAGDTNGEADLFLRDTIAGTTTRVSVATNGAQIPANTFQSAFLPSISADGRFVAFQSNVPLGGIRGEGRTSDAAIFVRDVAAGTTTQVSVNSSGTAANAASLSPSISADGRFVAFQSLASNLVPEDTGIDYDVFVHDRLTRTTTLVSVNSQGQKGTGNSTNEVPDNNSSRNPVLSPNGRYVVFESGATNLVPNDTNGVTDLFMRDLQTQQTARISVSSSGNQANGSSGLGFSKSAVSSDGRFVVFQSFADNLVPGDTNNALDVFVRDTVAGTTSRVSVNNDGQEPLSGFLRTASFDGSISADGGRIVFMSNGKNMNSAGFDTPQMYLRQFSTPTSSTSSPAPNQPGGSPPTPGNSGSNSGTILTGTNGRDQLIGTDGEDSLVGGRGNDVLQGGVGRDRFVYRNPRDRFDRIADFTIGEDKIVLSQLLNRLVGGNYTGRNAIRDKLVQLVRRGANTQVEIDMNGRNTPGGFTPLVLVEDVSVARLRNPSNFVF